MAKRQRNDTPRQYSPPPPRAGRDSLALVTVGGVVALLVISFSNWREIDRIEGSLDNRLDKIESRIDQVADQVGKLPAQAAPAAQPPRRGPDPNRVYQIKTAGAPIKGVAGAAVTIAEFSDFQ